MLSHSGLLQDIEYNSLCCTVEPRLSFSKISVKTEQLPVVVLPLLRLEWGRV